MSQESNPVNDSQIPAQPNTAGRDEVFDRIAAGLYSLASMLVGEGEDGVRMVEMAVANSEESVCHNPAEARMSSRRMMCVAALDILSRRDPGSLAAPERLKPAETCIEDDDLEAAGVSSEELERMIAGPDRDRMRKWLASLPTVLRTIFVLRAVAGFTSTESAALLATHGGARAAGWTPAAVGEFFRQGLCSLASQLIQASSPR
jgi:DNA-directed RNA polymerase specialized sigma24 family protein